MRFSKCGFRNAVFEMRFSKYGFENLITHHLQKTCVTKQGWKEKTLRFQFKKYLLFIFSTFFNIDAKILFFIQISRFGDGKINLHSSRTRGTTSAALPPLLQKIYRW
jgi:hypothetical protein